MKSLFASHIGLVGKVLDMRLERQNVVMSNLANIKTPNYKALRLEFEDELQAAMGLDARGKLTVTDKEHLPSRFVPGKFNAEYEKALKPRLIHGEDTVDLDKEMAVMGKNSLMYNALTLVLKKNFEGVKSIIQEGKS